MQKNDLIISGKYKAFLEKKKEFYKIGLDVNEKENYTDYFSNEEIDLAFKIYNSTKQRKKRNLDQIIRWCFLMLRLRSYEKYRMVFITLTFKDEDFEKLSEITRRRYVQRFLNKNTFHYIANVDYSPKEREHYHALAMIENDIDLKEWGRRIGIENVPIRAKDLKAVKNYLLKLNNHSYKESTRQKRILCDRHEDPWLDYFIDNVWDEAYKRFKMSFIKYDSKI